VPAMAAGTIQPYSAMGGQFKVRRCDSVAILELILLTLGGPSRGR
jgi:hypothetical protein